ncbi:hypothetical protein ADT27_16100 [Xanthomonas oryzae]|nr:hypothetical protein ADT27_16100 [Xanthomonas oryzae]
MVTASARLIARSRVTGCQPGHRLPAGALQGRRAPLPRPTGHAHPQHHLNHEQRRPGHGRPCLRTGKRHCAGTGNHRRTQRQQPPVALSQRPEAWRQRR